MHMTMEKEPDTAVIDLTAATTHLESDEEHVHDTEVVSAS